MTIDEIDNQSPCYILKNGLARLGYFPIRYSSTPEAAILSLLDEDDSKWIDERLTIFRYQHNEEIDAPGRTDSILAVSNLTGYSSESLESFDNLHRLLLLAARVVIAIINKREDVVLLHLWCIAPPGTTESTWWRTFQSRLRRDDRFCPKDIWLPSPAPDKWEDEAVDFFKKGPLATPWQSVSDRDESGINLLQSLYEGSECSKLSRSFIEDFDKIVRGLGTYDDHENAAIQLFELFGLSIDWSDLK
ncbi:hypothetical protein EA187_14340 [Lujinxingia sediminis]|uniref:Uncharacterized protein n=1 Tax=Lujinxingia sediminis TaxID=2480984 RepID=A0ABY0CR76_9DELT|nr:hypothetical protein [Lujinxingia sediminis]RVU43010.1 hypothetical protein EA187_14340 [Lujinxingia sediminis]